MTRDEYTRILNELNQGRVPALVLRDVDTVTIVDESPIPQSNSRYRLIVVNDIPIAGIWYSKGRPPLAPYQELDENGNRIKPETEPKKRGNYTHGERAYSHVTSEVVDMLYKDGVKGNIVNQQAALFALTKYIEWGTGRFRKLRKDRKGNDKMQLQDIEKAIRRSKKVTKQTMYELVANGIVKVIDGEFYFVNGLISKGRKK
jgi:hypothetical protein